MSNTNIRKNTLKCTFTEKMNKPGPAKIHEWIEETLQLTIDQMEAIQLDNIECAVYIKLTNKLLVEKIIQSTNRISQVRKFNGSLSEV